MKTTSLISATLLCITLITASCTKKEKTESKMETAEADAIYTCSMHPEVESKEPGKCPKCGMDLVKKEKSTSAPMDSTMDMSKDSTKKM